MSITSRALGALLAASAVVTAGLAATPAQAAETSERDPVVFVHGLFGNTSNFSTMRLRLFFAGYPSSEMLSFGYDSTGSMLDAADELDDAIDELLDDTGADRVDIVTHSLGGLPSRWYIRQLGGLDTVDDWISLGGPNLGGDPGTCPAPGSVACEQATKGSSFVTQLNAGDPTPGDVTYTTFSSPCDSIVDQAWTRLPGAENHDVGCLSHTDLLRDRGVYDDVRATLTG